MQVAPLVRGFVEFQVRDGAARDPRGFGQRSLVKASEFSGLAQAITGREDRDALIPLGGHGVEDGTPRKFAQENEDTPGEQTCASAYPMRRFTHMPKTAPLIGSAQAAKILKVSRATFNRWVAAGEVPVAVEMDGLTGARLFDADVIEALAAAKVTTAGDVA
jgi:predicted DNA-binding transcriptional regulator AlpA